MARARNIKPGFYKNEDLAECSVWARLIFPGLWTLADREGRLEDRPKRIKGELLPFDSQDVDKLLDELAKREFILRYEVGGKRYIQIIKFGKHQAPHHREVPSVIPQAPGFPDRYNHEPVSPEQRDRIFERDDYTCVGCGSKNDLQIDHKKSRAEGGTSDDSNLQTLCGTCNVRKGDRDEPRQGELIEGHQPKPNQGTASPHHAKGSNRSDSLIPDSSSTDSRLRTADSPSTASGGYGQVNSLPASKKTAGSITWDAYAAAYERKYKTPPLRNGETNSKMARFVALVGAEDAPAVAEFYLSLDKRYYVEKQHPVGALVTDASSIYTQWKTGARVTETGARLADRTAETGAQAQRFLNRGAKA